MHKWLCSKKKNKCWGILDSFWSPRAALVWPAENQIIRLHAQQQSCYTLEHGLTWLWGKRHSLSLHKLRAEHKASELQQRGPSLGTCMLTFNRWNKAALTSSYDATCWHYPPPCTTWLAEFVSPWGGRASSSPRLNIWNRTPSEGTCVQFSLTFCRYPQEG